MMPNRVAVIAMEEERGLVDDASSVVVTGVGAINVIGALSSIDRSTPLINVGYAGSRTVDVGERVRIGKVRLHHPNAAYDERSFELDGNVACYTSSDFVTESEISEPCVFDMELAYILAMGFSDVIAEKVVSDRLSTREFEETAHGKRAEFDTAGS